MHPFKPTFLQILFRPFLLILGFTLIYGCDKEEVKTILPEDLQGVWYLHAAFERESSDSLDVPEITISFHDANCATLYSTCNVAEYTYSIDGNVVAINTDKRYERCNYKNEDEYLKSLNGEYDVHLDTLRILSEKHLDMVFYKAHQMDPYQCDITTRLVDTVPTNWFYDTAVFNLPYNLFHGKWYIYDTYGGFGGGSHIPYFDFLEIKPNGIYAFVKQFTILNYGKMQINRKISEGSVYIDFIPSFYSDEIFISSRDTFKWLARFEGKDSLFFSPLCVGCGNEFVRVE